mgnify:CR=1 FL=1
MVSVTGPGIIAVATQTDWARRACRSAAGSDLAVTVPVVVPIVRRGVRPAHEAALVETSTAILIDEHHALITCPVVPARAGLCRQATAGTRSAVDRSGVRSDSRVRAGSSVVRRAGVGRNARIRTRSRGTVDVGDAVTVIVPAVAANLHFTAPAVAVVVLARRTDVRDRLSRDERRRRAASDQIPGRNAREDAHASARGVICRTVTAQRDVLVRAHVVGHHLARTAIPVIGARHRSAHARQ